jgi:hypothetical protein
MIMFGVLFAINLVAALVAFLVFIIGLADGSVTTANILIWAAVLGLLFSVPWAAWLVRLRGQARLGTLLLVPLAVLAVLGAVVVPWLM